MALFNRKKEVVEEVPELERYYAERRTSSAWSWVMALVTMILTVLIILGLFYGGRWVYRELNNNDETTVTTETTPTVNAPQNPPAGSQNGTNSTGTLPAGESNTPTASNSQPNSSAQTTPTQTNTTANSNLPNSGPGEVFSLALVAFIGAYLTKLYLIAKKQKV